MAHWSRMKLTYSTISSRSFPNRHEISATVLSSVIGIFGKAMQGRLNAFPKGHTICLAGSGEAGPARILATAILAIIRRRRLLVRDVDDASTIKGLPVAAQ